MGIPVIGYNMKRISQRQLKELQAKKSELQKQLAELQIERDALEELESDYLYNKNQYEIEYSKAYG